MLLLGFRLDNDLKLEFENNFENDLLFVENIMSFMEAIKSRKYEAIVIDERNSKEDALINLIIKIKLQILINYPIMLNSNYLTSKERA